MKTFFLVCLFVLYFFFNQVNFVIYGIKMLKKPCGMCRSHFVVYVVAFFFVVVVREKKFDIVTLKGFRLDQTLRSFTALEPP